MKKTEFVEQFYVMNPETEDVFPTGNDLRTGMEVLILDPMLRQTIKPLEEMTPGTLYSALVWNRWCKIDSAIRHDGRVRSFVGAYEDGTKMTRTFNVGHPWLVKKDNHVYRLYKRAGGFDPWSISYVRSVRSEIVELVSEAMLDLDAVVYSGNRPRFDVRAKAEETADKIIELF